MATIKRFEELIMWQQARLLVQEVYKMMKPRNDYGFRDQIQRAAVSVLSNIAEGFERGTKQEFLNYLFIAKGSAGEVRAQLYVAYDLHYLDTEQFKTLKLKVEEISRLIYGFISKLKKSNIAGTQYKRERHSNPLKEMLTSGGLVMTRRGMMKKEEAARQQLEEIAMNI